MKHRLTLALLLLGAAQAAPVWPGSGSGGERVSPEARRAVESFCEGDFHALQARESLATRGPAGRKAHAQDAGWPQIDWTWDPLTVVVAYRIRDVVTHDSTGSATVEYDELARSPGRRRFVGLPRRASALKLNLRKSGEAWRVFDPPEPRVSQHALVAIYAAGLAARNESWFRRASEEQVNAYQSEVAALRFLKSLK
jgi:hypothetical protein